MKIRALILVGWLAGAAAPPLHADWLVTRQDERFEIKGAWQLKGKLVVFTLPNGALSSLRADRIDFEASKRLTGQAKKDSEAAATPATSVQDAKPKRKAVIVLTDKDFQKAPPPATGAAADTGKGAGDKAPRSTKEAPGGTSSNDRPATKEVPNAVEVVTWDRVPASESKVNGVELTGTLRNASQDFLTEITVVGSLYDDTGTIVARIPATVEKQLLPATESSAFHLAAAGVFTFSTVKWETHGRALNIPQEPKAPAAGNTR